MIGGFHRPLRAPPGTVGRGSRERRPVTRHLTVRKSGLHVKAGGWLTEHSELCGEWISPVELRPHFSASPTSEGKRLPKAATERYARESNDLTETRALSPREMRPNDQADETSDLARLAEVVRAGDDLFPASARRYSVLSLGCGP